MHIFKVYQHINIYIYNYKDISICHTYKSKDHLAQCALHPRQVDSLGPSGMQGGQLGQNKDPTEDPHGPHKAGDKPLSNKCCTKMRMKIKGGFKNIW